MAVAIEPSVNYKLQCMGCHAPDGSGAEGRVPSMRSTLLPFSAVAAGRQFLRRTVRTRIPHNVILWDMTLARVSHKV